MKYTNFKTWALMLSISALLALSGCDNGGGISYVVGDEIPPSGVTPPPVVTPPPGSTDPKPGELGYQTILANGDIEYVDYTGGTRVSPPSAAKAEYHTGTGYGSTLFDSPKNKCQNCHNELYDTWKDSMHGKSWTDPIFQSKMQDFLRTHINKIGEDLSAKDDGFGPGIVYEEATVGVGTKSMFKGAAKTCIKCHAPGAFYANDFSISITELPSSPIATTDELLAAQKAEQTNSISTTGTFDATVPVSVVAVSKGTKKLYKATYQVGHQSNQEGISCAFCHSVETPRLMKSGDTYTLKKDMRSGAHGPVIRSLATILNQDNNASSQDMNNFFRLWGPEKPVAYNNTNKDADDVSKRASDGRYTMTSVDINGTNGKTHYTGGPYYGPYGVSGKSNENADDQTDRIALINPHFDADTNNHFGDKEITTGEAGDHGKSLCLTCHQRSAGAKTPAVPGQFMELCSTQMAVTTGGDTAINDSLSSPKCQKCHMERIEGNLLHQWARPDLSFDAQTFKDAVGYDLTPQLDEKDTTIPAGDNPQRDGWFNSHAFLGASKTGHKTSATAKIQSGFAGSISTSVTGDTLTVTTIFTNKTAHMFPGAHPMRRVLSRVIVTDGTGAMIDVASSTGTSTFTNIENDVQPLQGKVLHESALALVPVHNNGSADLSFPGKVPDLNGAVTSQKFDSTTVRIPGTDTTLTNQTVSTSGTTTGDVANAAIAIDSNLSNFTRVYGHETGKMYDLDSNTSTPSVFVVRPGFDSNKVESDNRLSPNETETYTTTYDITGLTGVSATYKIYYMQKGANGKFLTGSDGWLDQAASDAKKLLVTEVGSYTEAL
ncbi:MAG: hypothetical protein COB07_08530 [Sulfurovum sp.]|nr:MAG: hypothetical protein COB07_08530 [Sulfurovum sp.]